MSYSDITPRRHSLQKCGGALGRFRYPFRAMVVGDFFLVSSQDHATKVHKALSTFYRSRSGVGRRFTVVRSEEGCWTCRRTI